MVEYAKARQMRRYGMVVGCYPMGKGVGLILDEKRHETIDAAEKDGWQVSQLRGVGHDYNLHGDLFRLTREAFRYVVVDSRLRGVPYLLRTDKRKEVYEWVLDGLRGTEGSERDRYVNVLLQLEDGKTTLDYDGSW